MRLAAVEALASSEIATRQRYLARMLDDPVRVVRIEAARALAGAAEQGLAPAQRTAFDKALAEYIAVQTYNADRPEGTDESGQHLRAAARRGRARSPNTARRSRSIRHLSAAYVNLADLYRAGNMDSEAEKTLREGIARNPREAVCITR